MYCNVIKLVIMSFLLHCFGLNRGIQYTLNLFPIGPSSLLAVVAQPDDRLANRTQKSALHWCG